MVDKNLNIAQTMLLPKMLLGDAKRIQRVIMNIAKLTLAESATKFVLVRAGYR